MVALAETELGPPQRSATMTVEDAIKTRRLKYLVVSWFYFEMMFQQGKDGRYVKVCEPGLPDDFMIVGMSEHYLFRTGQIALQIYSATFDVVPEGSAIQDIDLMVQEVKLAEPVTGCNPSSSQTQYKYGGQL